MMNTIITTLKDNWLISISITAVIAYFTYNKIKENMDIKKEKQKILDEQQRINLQPEPENKEEPNMKEEQENNKQEETDEELIRRIFAEHPLKNTETEPIDNLTNLSKQITKDAEHIVQKMKNEKERLKQELVETTKKTREIEKYGAELARLHEVYKEREQQLINSINQKQ